MTTVLHLVSVFPNEQKYGIERYPRYGWPVTLPGREQVIARVSTLVLGVAGSSRACLQVTSPEWLAAPAFEPFQVEMTLEPSDGMSQLQKHALLETELQQRLPSELLNVTEGTELYVLILF